MGEEQSPDVLLGCQTLISPNQRFEASITGKVSPLIRYMALAMPQATGLVRPRWDITNGGMLEITPGISRRGTGLIIDLRNVKTERH